MYTFDIALMLMGTRTDGVQLLVLFIPRKEWNLTYNSMYIYGIIASDMRSFH